MDGIAMRAITWSLPAAVFLSQSTALRVRRFIKLVISADLSESACLPVRIIPPHPVRASRYLILLMDVTR